MNKTHNAQQFDTVVIGGGQAGLAVGYYLTKQDRDFVILDANDRSGASWRNRWDSLRLFTPARYSSLPGMPFPAAADTFLPKDQVADYLESYAARFRLPIRRDTAVDRLTRQGDRHLLTMGDQQIEAAQVVVATGAHQRPRTPAFASLLDPAITQFHSSAYRNPDQLREGGVLIVGAGSSGAEIALELARTRRTWLAGRDTGHIPKNIPPLARALYWRLIHTAINTDNKIGRRFKALIGTKGAPLVGIDKRAFARAGVERTPRMAGVREGKPVLDDGRALDVANVIWCTGYAPDYGWIDLPVFGSDGHPVHARGVVQDAPGLYFLGLPFQYTLTSSFIGGVGRDADYIARQIAVRTPMPVGQAAPTGKHC